MKAERLEFAIDALCRDVASHPPRSSWDLLGESGLFREISACILGSQVSYEMAYAATELLGSTGMFDEHRKCAWNVSRVEQILSQPLHHPSWQSSRRYRFPRARAQALTSAAEWIRLHTYSIKSWLNTYDDHKLARCAMVTALKGIGPKQASMILRNIGYCSDIAILDTHVLRFMSIVGLTHARASEIATLAKYEHLENALRQYARVGGWSLAIMDRAIWAVMRVAQNPDI